MASEEDGVLLQPTDQAGPKAKWANLMKQNRLPVLHKKTSVLLLYWDKECADFDVQPEVGRLENVFKSKYRFNVVTRCLNTAALAQAQAFNHLSNFVLQEDSENGLLIVYYAGHGGSETSSLGSITLSGKYACGPIEKLHCTIDWPDVEKVLAKTKSDVFEIFDCCHAGLLCTPIMRNGTRCFEFLAACGPKDRTPTAGDHSFTSAMIHALEQLSSRSGFYTNELLATIQLAPDFSRKQGPQLYGARFETQGEYLYIAPTPAEGEESLGVFRDQRDREHRQEEMLDLRFHFDGDITEDDLKNTAEVLIRALGNPKKIRAGNVSLIGKYNMKTYEAYKEDRIRKAVTGWKNWVVRRRGDRLLLPQLHVRPRADSGISIALETPLDSGFSSSSGSIAMELTPDSSPSGKSKESGRPVRRSPRLKR